MTPERAIEVLSKLGKPTGGTLNWSKTGQEWCDAVLMGAAALAEVAALRAELAEAKAILDKLEHGQHWDIYDNKCLACARDARWPKKETT